MSENKLINASRNRDCEVFFAPYTIIQLKLWSVKKDKIYLECVKCLIPCSLKVLYQEHLLTNFQDSTGNILIHFK